MPKASSPVRLESTLMEAASVAGEALHRSAAEQIEYWADLGRAVAMSVNAESLLAVKAGLARVSVETVPSTVLDVDTVFDALDRDRESGQLSAEIASGFPRFQASMMYPGYLERVEPNGDVTVGQFKNGVFRKAKIPQGPNSQTKSQ